MRTLQRKADELKLYDALHSGDVADSENEYEAAGEYPHIEEDAENTEASSTWTGRTRSALWKRAPVVGRSELCSNAPWRDGQGLPKAASKPETRSWVTPPARAARKRRRERDDPGGECKTPGCVRFRSKRWVGPDLAWAPRELLLQVFEAQWRGACLVLVQGRPEV